MLGENADNYKTRSMLASLLPTAINLDTLSGKYPAEAAAHILHFAKATQQICYLEPAFAVH